MIRGSLLGTEPMFLHTKKYFPYLLEKNVSTYQTQEVVIKAICLSFPSSETALAFLLETALMPEGHRKPRDLKTMTAFGFWPLLFPLLFLLFLCSLIHSHM